MSHLLPHLLTALRYLGAAAFCYFTVILAISILSDCYYCMRAGASGANWREVASEIGKACFEVLLSLGVPARTAIIGWWLLAGQLPMALQCVGLVALVFTTLAADPQMDVLWFISAPFSYLVFDALWLGGLTAFAWQVSGGKWVPTLIYGALVGVIRMVRVVRVIRGFAELRTSSKSPDKK